MGKIINSPETVIPDYVSLRQVYEGVRIPDEDEAIWMIGEARLDDYYKVVKFNPMKEGKEFVSWNGVRFGSIRHFACPEVLSYYRDCAKEGEWVGFIALQTENDGQKTMLDGYHRLKAMIREGVTEAYYVDIAQPLED